VLDGVVLVTYVILQYNGMKTIKSETLMFNSERQTEVLQILSYILTFLIFRVIGIIQGDQKASMHLMITVKKVTINVQNVPRHSPDIY
jgi:hypothetical protein